MDPISAIGAASDALSSLGSISSAFAARNKKFERGENYLEKVIIEKGHISKQDEEIAAKLFLIPSSRRKIKNVAKIIKKADSLYESLTSKSEEPHLPDDEWMDYFLDKSSLISNESVQNIWSAILAGECGKRDSSVSKVMLDRLALLDDISAQSFGALCEFVVRADLSSGLGYYIPLYIRDDDLIRLSKEFGLSEEMAVRYQSIRPTEKEMELLQEIGLIHFSDLNDEGEIFEITPFSFSIYVQEELVFDGSSIAGNNDYHNYFITGAASFSMIGQSLYEVLKDTLNQDRQLLTSVVTSYYQDFSKG